LFGLTPVTFVLDFDSEYC
jgi:hypothetical protein